jgi:hypothetical protein
MTARVNTQLYLLFKIAYSGGEKSLEERIEELMQRDLDGLLKTDWYREKIAGDYFEMVANKLKAEDGVKGGANLKGDPQLDGDFNGNGDKE